MTFLNQERLIEEELGRFRAELEASIDPSLPRRMLAILRHIHTHLFDPDLHVEGALNACGIRSHEFPLRFRYRQRKTLRCYIEDRRILAAIRLVTYPELRTSDVAFNAGYTNYRTFARAFKRRTGFSPSTLQEVLSGVSVGGGHREGLPL